MALKIEIIHYCTRLLLKISSILCFTYINLNHSITPLVSWEEGLTLFICSSGINVPTTRIWQTFKKKLHIYQVSDHLTRERESKLLLLAKNNGILCFIQISWFIGRINNFTNCEQSKNFDITAIQNTIYFSLNFVLHALTLDETESCELKEISK